MFHLHPKRNGLTLVEMLVAMAVMGILIVGLSGMVTTIHQSNEFVRTQGEALQHARVSIERIERICRGATATRDYPGFWVVSETFGAYSFPDALVVWSPESGTPANLDGPPLLSELVVYTYDDASPESLIEVTARSAVGDAPALSETSVWQSLINVARTSDVVTKIELTDLLRVADAGVSGSEWRGVLRFETRHHPTATELASYEAGSANWEDLTWPLDIYGADFGVRQSWCAMEIQLVPRGETRRGEESETHALAFFGSASLSHTLEP